MDEPVVEEVRRAFALPPGTLTPEPVARGQLGVVYRYDALDGRRWAVKHVIGPVTEAEVDPTAKFEEAARRHGVAVPDVRRTTSGTVLARAAGHTFRVSTWVDVRPADTDLDSTAVGALLAHLHTVPSGAPRPGSGTALHPWYREPVGAPAWDELVSSCLRRGAPFAERLAAHRDELVALEGLLSPPTTLRTCHRDLFADNVRETDPGGICVFDFDNSGPADPSQELAFVVVEFATTALGVVDQTRGQALLEAYAAAGGPGRLTGPGSFSMVVAVLGHLAQLSAGRWLSTTDPVAQDVATSLMMELLDRPLTREVVHGLLTLP